MWKRILPAAALALASLAAFGDDGGPAEPVREKIAALDVEGAKKALADYKAANKTPEARKTAADLEREIATAKKIESVAGRVSKLLDQGKPREAYAAGMAIAEQFPGALALAALRPRIGEARRAAFLTLDDFDAPETAKWAPHGSQMVYVPDPLGGKALHWTASAGKGKTFLDLKLPEKVSLAGFEYVSVRLRAPHAQAGTLDIGLDLEARNNAGITPALKYEADGKWHEVRVPLESLEKGRGFDPTQVAWVILYYKGTDDIDLYVDDLLLARRAPH